MKSKPLNLLPTDALLKTGEVDHADWNHKPILGAISRARFHLIKKLIDERHSKRLMEIGYGSGVFMPELAKYTNALYGIDVHQKQDKIVEVLTRFNVKASLASNGAEKIVWQDDFFDFIVAVSALEFVNDLEKVCREVTRVLRPSGSFFVVTPGHSPILDFGLKILTGNSAKEDFADRREMILPTLFKHFNVKKEIAFPKYGSSFIKLYTALELQPKS